MSFSKVATKVIVTDGDSLTAGVSGVTPWPSIISLPGWTIHNVAVSGRTLATCVADAATGVDPFYDSLASENVVTIWAGTNDIEAGATVTDTYANLVTYVAARHAVGWKVIVITMLSRGSPSNIDVQKNQYNALLLANTAGADAIVSFVGTPLGIDGGFSDTTYFLVDEIHPNQTSVTTIETPAFLSTITGLVVAPPAFLFVQSSSGNGSGSSVTRAFTNATAAKNVLVALAWCSNSVSITSFGDGVNTWRQIGSGLTPTGFKANVYVCDSAVGGAVSATLHLSGSASNTGVGLIEYSGPFRPSSVNQSVANSGSTTPASIGPITPAAVGDALVAIGFVGALGPNFTRETGWQARLDSTDAVFAEDRIAGNAGTYTATGVIPATAWAGMLLDFEKKASNVATLGKEAFGFKFKF